MNHKNNNKRLWRRWLSLGVCAALILPLISDGWNTAWAEPSKASVEQRVLRIGSLWSGEDDWFFRQQFTDMYELQHPEIKLEIIPAIDTNDLRYNNTPSDASSDNLEYIRAIMGGDKPVDVIIGDSALVKSLVDHNLVQSLEPLIARDQYDLSNMAPTMLNGVRELGRGSLFALAPIFSSSALFYNKGIFDAAGVGYPTDKMTWNELFTLADKVTKKSSNKETRIYGFSMNRYLSDPFWDMQSYVAPLELKMYDNKGQHMTVNTTQWNQAWTTYSQLVKKQIVPELNGLDFAGTEGNTYSPIQGDLFLTGKAAMVVGEYGYLNELAGVARNAAKIKNYSPIKWGVVTVPTFQEKPDVAIGTWLGNMMAITSTATNKEDAWDLIKFVNSNEVAKIKAHNKSELTSRKDYIIAQTPSVNLEAFYTLKPLPATDPLLISLQMQKPGISQIGDVGRQLFIDVYQGKKTVENALKSWEKQGNTMLDTLEKDPTVYFNSIGE
ncbi:ABC transporter substrate-binding protein [Paenibacillus sp. B2(2019)]|uniref:ABC transporter substrate-binding protein n=1 Tax=Paenibacillus sp. B2(2019) TaxID=2607754 RepID=UPI0011F3D389|nr:extracellular solute-binding protein [Paenibacillus sp. B2(2019)]KAA1179035.1 extracellular solute-binding protein [Paenibacillus sp. B2(2019)]